MVSGTDPPAVAEVLAVGECEPVAPNQVVTRGAIIVAAQTAHVTLEDKVSGTERAVMMMSIYLHLGRHRQLEETDSVPQESRSWGGGQIEWMWCC